MKTVGKKSDARLRVQLIDVNDEYPKFVGLDEDGKYTAAVSGTTQKDDYVLRVKAIDLDGTSPNNKVSVFSITMQGYKGKNLNIYI